MKATMQINEIGEEKANELIKELSQEGIEFSLSVKAEGKEEIFGSLDALEAVGIGEKAAADGSGSIAEETGLDALLIVPRGKNRLMMVMKPRKVKVKVNPIRLKRNWPRNC